MGNVSAPQKAVQPPEITPAMLAAARTVWMMVDGKEVRVDPEAACLLFNSMWWAYRAGDSGVPSGRV